MLSTFSNIYIYIYIYILYVFILVQNKDVCFKTKKKVQNKDVR